jgi:hypothetical protein
VDRPAVIGDNQLEPEPRASVTLDDLHRTGNIGLPAFTARPGEPRVWGTQFTLRR